jgi:hypothetical protein
LIYCSIDGDKWALLEKALADADEEIHELCINFEFPEHPNMAVPREEALEFCRTARSVIQAERNAETLFHIFRDSRLSLKKESERSKAARLQKDTIRAQNVAKHRWRHSKLSQYGCDNGGQFCSRHELSGLAQMGL